MNHPMLTYAVMLTRQEDLARDLRRRELPREAARSSQFGPTRRTSLRRRFAAYVARRPRTAPAPVWSADC